jgi:hypothetical protein
MARFATAQGSEGIAIGTIADVANTAGGRTVTAIAAAATSAPSGAAFINGIFTTTGGSTCTLTTPTAAQIVSAMPNCQVGSSGVVRIYNANSGTFTVTAGSSVTVTGPTTVATNKALGYDLVVTNATAGSEAVSLIAHTYAAA